MSCHNSLQTARASFYLQQAEACISKGEYELASDYLVKADQILVAISEEERKIYLLTAKAFWLQSSIYYSKGNTGRAREELLNALRSLEAEATGKRMISDILNRLGNISYYEGDMEEALSYYQQGSNIAAATNEYATAAKATNNIGNIYMMRGDIDLAAACYSQGVKYAEQAGPVALAQSFSALTWLYSNYGPFTLALSYAEKAVTLAEEIDSVNTRCQVLMQSGAVYLKYGSFDKAELLLREAYTLVQKTGNRLIEQQVLAELAELLRQKNDTEGWETYVLKAFRASASSPLLRKEAALPLISYYIKQQDCMRAQRTLETMKANRQPGDEREDALIRQGEAVLAAAFDRWDEALSGFKFAIDSGTLTDYELAVVWQDYAITLLRLDRVRPNRATYVQGFDAAEKAKVMLTKLGLAHRFIADRYLLAAVAALIDIADCRKGHRSESASHRTAPHTLRAGAQPHSTFYILQFSTGYR